MSPRAANRLAKRERQIERREMRILLRLLVPMLVVALVHLTLAIRFEGLIIVGIGTFVAVWLLPRAEAAIRGWRRRERKPEE